MSALRSGLNLVILSLFLWALYIVAILAALSANWHFGVLEVLSGCLGFLIPVVAITGKAICTRSPVHADIVQGSLVFEVLALGLGFLGLGAYATLSGLVGSLLFLGYIYRLGEFLEEPRICESVQNSLRFAGASLIGLPLLILLAWVRFPAPYLAIFYSALCLLAGVVFYLRSLFLLRNTVTSATSSGPVL